PYALIMLMKLSNDTLGTLTDSNGKALLKVKKSEKEFEITMPNIGFKRFSLRAMADNCKDITINLAQIPFETVVEKGTKMKFEIKKEDRDELILRKDKFDLVFTRKKK